MPANPPAPFQLPTEALPEVANLPNPVIPNDMQFSKDNFNAALAAEKSESETPPEATPTPEATPVETQTPEPVPEKGTTDDTKIPESKPFLPEELLTGKKPEPKVDDAISEIDAMVLPKNAKPEQVASFSKLKAEAKRIIEERTARITQLESSTSNGATKAEIEAAQERVKAAEAKAKEFESTIERLAFTESPRFQRFVADEAATLTTAKSYLEGTEINPDIIDYAARLSGSKRIQVLTEAGADPNIIAAVSPYLAQYDNIQRHKSGALENWKSEQGQFLEQQKAQQAAQMEQRKKSEDEVWSTTVHELKDLVPLRKFDKNDSWNTRAEEILQRAKTVYNGDGVDLKTVAEKLIKGEGYDALDELRIVLTEELNKVREENARLKAAKPGASNGQGSSGISNDANLSPVEASKARFNRELAAARGG